MQHVLALASHLAVQAHHASFGLFAFLRSFLASRHDALGVSEAFERTFLDRVARTEPTVAIDRGITERWDAFRSARASLYPYLEQYPRTRTACCPRIWSPQRSD